ncbi:DUF1517 domain-containing protein [Waterburya agarophytonicola K14]|uniref:DUF1517 domain-containing protein n=1 Tax=Waterburya agarophytonicola KI4 TaxID=2874699 RepID=A0A964BS26_9CYAN|nr:DUF1517 domain-containing protein [Waterburya agarophytonicola]MCC0176810.1 DUF1517 domain-containing protein [Waterburya agarophytonicola KI4]
MIFNKKFWIKSILALGLVCVLVLGNASTAMAARTGGRIGGGSFRAPSRSYSTPRSAPGGGGYVSPGYGYGGGGFGFPFLLPFIGFGGGGGLFSIIIFIAIANFLIRSFRSAGVGEESVYGAASSKVSVAEVQVGLLANARELQPELNRLALTADTSTASGRATVVQEATLALLRHPEYWVYGSTNSVKTDIDSAEAKFNQFSLTERSKFTEETLSNVDSVINSGDRKAIEQALKEALNEEPEAGEIQLRENDNGEYIVATVIVGATGNLNLPEINDSDSMRQALQQIGSVGSDRLLAVEILWTPQGDGDTLSSDDILAYYPNLKLV